MVQTDAAKMTYFLTFFAFFTVFVPWLIHCVEPFHYDTADFTEIEWSDFEDSGLAFMLRSL